MGLGLASSGEWGCARGVCCKDSVPCDSKERTDSGAEGTRDRAPPLAEPHALCVPASVRRATEPGPRHQNRHS